MALVEHEQGHYVNNVKFQFFIYSYLPKLKNINTLSTKTKKINLISNNEKVLTEKTINSCSSIDILGLDSKTRLGHADTLFCFVGEE